MIQRINILNQIGRFTELQFDAGEQGNFAKLNVINAKNATGKSTLCDVLRSMTTGQAAYLLGRKRLNATTNPEIVVALAGGPPTQTVRFQNDTWQNLEATPNVQVFDERFVADNVLVGHHINVDQRRNLYGFVIGAQGIALRQAVDMAEAALARSTQTINSSRGALQRLIPEGRTIETFKPLPVVEEVDHEIQKAANALERAAHIRTANPFHNPQMTRDQLKQLEDDFWAADNLRFKSRGNQDIHAFR